MAKIASFASVLLFAGAASAQRSNWSTEYREDLSSPEYFGFEFRVGTYTPNDPTGAFGDFFDDKGPMLHVEFDIYPYRIPYVGLVGIGLSGAWANYSASACQSTNCTTRVSDKADFTIFPVAALAVLRIDALAQELNIPLVFTGKLGLDMVIFTDQIGATTIGEGISLGLRWAAQAALQLDFIEERAARRLDDEWGINHSYIMFELFGSTADSKLPVGNGLAWSAGLGFTF